MERAIAGPVVIKRVLPATLELTWLTFAVLDILAEVDGLFGCDIKTNRLA